MNGAHTSVDIESHLCMHDVINQSINQSNQINESIVETRKNMPKRTGTTNQEQQQSDGKEEIGRTRWTGVLVECACVFWHLRHPVYA